LPLRAKLAVLVAALSLLLLAVLAALHWYGRGLGFFPYGLAVLLAGVGFYRLLAKSVAGPLERLVREVDVVRSGHEAAEPAWLEMEGRDEVGRLAAMVNDMNHSFFEARQRLQEKVNGANVALVSTVEQLQQRSSELNQRTEELEGALETISQLATTDSLTGLPNRRHFDERLEDALARARRFDEPLSVIMLDVDKFKPINDTLGHGAGDAVLSALGRLISSRTRSSDVSARLGGDEFAFILPRADRAEATALAEDLLERVRAHDFRYQGQAIPVTLSIGVAHFFFPPSLPHVMYKAADDALYEAKRQGRNRVAAASWTADGGRLAEE
jgi:diguanylate cyclase (GGDEF)-like protein